MIAPRAGVPPAVLLRLLYAVAGIRPHQKDQERSWGFGQRA